MTEPDHKPRSATWAAARQDYLSGDSAPVVAERHGLSERTLIRRAAVEGWRRADVDDPVLGRIPAWSRPAPKLDQIERQPELGDIDDARANDTFQLLFDPNPRELRRFAFRKAAELAAIDSPRQALIWLRLAQTLDRCGDRIDNEADIFKPIDHLRASFLRRMAAEFDDPEAEEPQTDASRG